MRATGKRQSDLLLFDAVDIFNADGIPYAVVGGFAAAVHGVDRGTKDMDVIVQVALPDLPQLVSRLKEAGFAATLKQGGFDDPIAAVVDLKDAYKNCVEILVGLKGLPSDAFLRAIEIPYRWTGSGRPSVLPRRRLRRPGWNASQSGRVHPRAGRSDSRSHGIDRKAVFGKAGSRRGPDTGIESEAWRTA